MAIFVFLLFNWRFYLNKNSLIFLGDSGTLFIGFVIAYFLIKLSQGEHRAIAPVTALWMFAFPIIETVTMMIRRILKGHSPFKADKEHFHHLLQSAGFNKHTTTLIIVFINVLCLGFGIILYRINVPESYLFYSFLLFFIAYYFMIARAWKVKSFLIRNFIQK